MPVKVAKIDAEGIAKGVVGGSTANKVGGAGGKAMKADHDDVLGAYDALFKQRLRAEFEPPPGLSDSLQAEFEVRSDSDGTLSGGRVIKSSGNPDFDRAVLEALLQKYQDEGVTDLDDPRILQIPPFDAMGTPLQLLKQFGNRRDFERAVHELQSALYEGVA